MAREYVPTYRATFLAAAAAGPAAAAVVNAQQQKPEVTFCF